MLVEEAKEKECCQFESKCMGEQCMAWRWFVLKIKHDGYCGLAGKEGAE